MLDRIGLQPLLGAEDRLERGVDAPLLPAQPLAQQARGFLTLAMVGIAFVKAGKKCGPRRSGW